MKDVEKVKVYHVDEYYEGARHFCFWKRKDIVLLEDYKKLQDENKQLKADLEQARSHKHTITMRNRNLHTENERLKRENSKLRCSFLHATSKLLCMERDKAFYYKSTKAMRIAEKWRHIFVEAYHKAKKELKEGK